MFCPSSPPHTPFPFIIISRKQTQSSRRLEWLLQFPLEATINHYPIVVFSQDFWTCLILLPLHPHTPSGRAFIEMYVQALPDTRREGLISCWSHEGQTLLEAIFSDVSLTYLVNSAQGGSFETRFPPGPLQFPQMFRYRSSLNTFGLDFFSFSDSGTRC